MPTCKIDLEGHRFGMLTVVARAPQTKSRKSRWLVQCDCGSAPKVVMQSNLRAGNTISCGCYREQLAEKRRRYKKSLLQDITIRFLTQPLGVGHGQTGTY